MIYKFSLRYMVKPPTKIPKKEPTLYPPVALRTIKSNLRSTLTLNLFCQTQDSQERTFHISSSMLVWKMLMWRSQRASRPFPNRTCNDVPHRTSWIFLLNLHSVASHGTRIYTTLSILLSSSRSWTTYLTLPNHYPYPPINSENSTMLKKNSSQPKPFLPFKFFIKEERLSSMHSLQHHRTYCRKMLSNPWLSSWI